MSNILKGIKINEADPRNFDSDIDYYNALNRKTRGRSEDDYVEPQDDEPIKFQQDPKARPEYSINKDEDRDAGYNMTLIVKAPTTQKAEFAADSYVDSNWGAKKQVGKITPIADGVVQVHMIDNHKYGMWKPWKDEEPIDKPISFNESAIINKASKLLESLSPESRTSIINELSNDLLGNYKKAASADATAADKKGDYKRGDKRFSGIVKATKKQFDNDEKKVPEGRYDSGDYYNARQGREYGAKSSQVDSGAYEFEKEVHRNEPGGEHGRPKNLKGVSKSLPADAFGRTTGKIPAGKTGRIHSMMNDVDEDLDENLHKWFKEKWVRFGPDGKIRGDCARGDDSEGKPKCLPQSKAQNLGKKGRASAAARKRREDPNPERSGKAINVNTKKKSNEGVAEGYPKHQDLSGISTDKLKAYLAKQGQQQNSGEGNQVKRVRAELQRREQGLAEEQLDELSCWSGYHRVAGTKAGFPGSCAKNKTNEQDVSEGLNEMDKSAPQPGRDGKVSHSTYGSRDKKGSDYFKGKEAPGKPITKKQMEKHALDILKKQGVAEEQHSCPHCGGEMVSEELMNEKKDACYYKVKSRYKVWPSAYASGALVKCRKSGADSWGNGGKKDESIEEGINDLGYDAQSLIMKLRRDVEERRLQPTPHAVLAAARELAGDMDFAPQLLVQQVLGKGVAEEQLDEKWTKKYKDSINCSNPKGFSQKAHCAGKQKNESAIMKGLRNERL